MNINYVIIAIVGILALALIIFTIRKNNREEKKFEETMYEEDVLPDKHEE